MANKEKETKKSGAGWHVNFLDVVLILLAILCIVGVWQRKNLQKLFTDEEVMESYTVTFEIKKLRSTTVELLQKGTELYLTEGEEAITLGTLSVPVSTAAATEYFVNADGDTVSAVYPQDQYEYLLDVTGTLTCRGIRRDNAFLLEGKTYLAVNQTVLAHTENADVTIRITSITKDA